MNRSIEYLAAIYGNSLVWHAITSDFDVEIYKNIEKKANKDTHSYCEGIAYDSAILINKMIIQQVVKKKNQRELYISTN